MEIKKIPEVCERCVDRHCCKGLCKEMNAYLAKKKREKRRTKHGRKR